MKRVYLDETLPPSFGSCMSHSHGMSLLPNTPTIFVCVMFSICTIYIQKTVHLKIIHFHFQTLIDTCILFTSMMSHITTYHLTSVMIHILPLYIWPVNYSLRNCHMLPPYFSLPYCYVSPLDSYMSPTICSLPNGLVYIISRLFTSKLSRTHRDFSLLDFHILLHVIYYAKTSRLFTHCFIVHYSLVTYCLQNYHIPLFFIYHLELLLDCSHVTSTMFIVHF